MKFILITVKDKKKDYRSLINIENILKVTEGDKGVFLQLQYQFPDGGVVRENIELNMTFDDVMESLKKPMKKEKK